MVKQGVLRNVDGPSDWVNSMVVVQKKDGSLRICIDPKDLIKSGVEKRALSTSNN